MHWSLLWTQTSSVCEVLNLAEIWKVFCLNLKKKKKTRQPDSSANLWSWFGALQTATDCAGPILKLHVLCEKSVKKCVKCTDGGEKINSTSTLTVNLMSQIRHLKKDLKPFNDMMCSARPQHRLSRHFPNCMTFKGYYFRQMVFKVVISVFDLKE